MLCFFNQSIRSYGFGCLLTIRRFLIFLNGESQNSSTSWSNSYQKFSQTMQVIEIQNIKNLLRCVWPDIAIQAQRKCVKYFDIPTSTAGCRRGGCGREAGCPVPPAQILAGGITASGAYLKSRAKRTKCTPSRNFMGEITKRLWNFLFRRIPDWA